MNGTTADLATQQQALLAALLGEVGDSKKIANYVHLVRGGGLKAYRANGHAAAERALRAAYPVVTQLLGDESLAGLARALWHAHPPHQGDLACWGEDLADFMARSAQLASEPYLSDLARLEWAVHRAACAPDAEPDWPSLALLSTHPFEVLCLRLAPGLRVVRSAWPVVSLCLAHTEAGATPEALARVGGKLRATVAESAVVWRQGWRPCLREADAAEADFLSAVLAGASLAEALGAAPALDVAAWLPDVVRSGILLGVCAMEGV